MIDRFGSDLNQSLLLARIKLSPRSVSWVLLLLLGSLAFQWNTQVPVNLEIFWLLVLLCLGYGLYWPMLQALVLCIVLPTGMLLALIQGNGLVSLGIPTHQILEGFSYVALSLVGVCLCALLGLYAGSIAAPARYKPKRMVFLFQAIVVILVIESALRWYLLAMAVPGQGYPPLLSLQQSLLFALASVSLLYLYFDKHAIQWSLGLLLAGTALVALIIILANHAMLLEASGSSLPLAGSSQWRYLQVGLNQFALAAFVLATLAALSQLLTPANTDGRSARIRQLDDLTYRSVALGFTVHTIGLFTTLLWASHVFGIYWAWLPDQVGLLVVWFNYAAWLHMHLTKGWRGTPMLIWLLVSMVLTWISLVSVITG